MLNVEFSWAKGMQGLTIGGIENIEFSPSAGSGFY